MTETQKLAERIARLLENEQQYGDLAALFAGLEKISHRLDKLEADLMPRTASPAVFVDHPSRDRFAVAEALSSEEAQGTANEKACAFEPNGKPCDHCSMCSARGF